MPHSLPLRKALSLLFCLLSLVGCASTPDAELGAWDEVELDGRARADGFAPVSRQSDYLERVVYGDRLHVDVRVANLGLEKEVGLRASFDGGEWRDFAGSYVEPMDAEGRFERWHVTAAPSGPWGTVRFAVYYRDFASHTVYWDNAGGSNYQLESRAAVSLGSATLDHGSLSIALRVDNRTYQKDCGARLTGDGWRNVRDVRASYVGPASEPGFERWELAANAADEGLAFLGNAAVVEYALFCSFDGAEAIWDNNGGANHRLYRTRPVTPQWTAAFEGAQDMTIADDGSVFVLSGEGQAGWPRRWVSSYGADGAWRFVYAFEHSIDRMEWVEAEELLVVGATLPSGERRWIGLSRDGAAKWSVDGALELFVRGESASYLVGSAGAAVVGQTRPIIVGPAGGCSGLPVISPRGLLFCATSTGTAAYDVSSGAHRFDLGAELPFAADAAGRSISVSADRSTFVGRDATGAVTWTREGLFVTADPYGGIGRACSNHGAGSVAVWLNQNPSPSYPDDQHFVGGVDIATGAELFRLEEGAHAYAPCPDDDGNFYYAPSYQRYARQLTRVTQSGERAQINLGLMGALLDARPDGRLVVREWEYWPNDRPRLRVLDADLGELYARNLSMTPQQGPALIALGGARRVVSFAFGALEALDL